MSLPVSPAAPAPGPRSHRLGRWARAMATALAVLVAVTSVGGWVLAHALVGRIERVDDIFGPDARRPGRSGHGVNYLVVGSDRRDGMSAADVRRLHLGESDGQRADTMILVHVSRRDEKATIISFPRDSYLDIPGHGRDKLNSAYSLGGPRLTVQTIENATGIRVDHYLEVDFLGFEKMVDALGGVDVCSSRPLVDPKAGLRLAAGNSTLDGRQGLAFVRARSVDGRGDLGRIERQQRFLGAIVHKATDRRMLLDTPRLTSFVTSALGAMRTDPDLDAKDLLQLAGTMRDLSPGNVTFATIPLADANHRVDGVGSTVLWDDAASEVFAAVREDRAVRPTPKPPAPPAPTVAPERIRVKVLDASGKPGVAERAAEDLQQAGFHVTGSGAAADAEAARTVLRYDSRYTESIKTLQAALPKASLDREDELGRTLQVVVGSDYDGLEPVGLSPRGGAAEPVPGALRTAASDLCA